MEGVIVAGVLALLGVVGVSLMPVMRYAPYAYGNARVRARSSRLFSEGEIRELARKEHIDIIYELDTRGYPLLSFEKEGFREESVQNLLRSRHFSELRELSRFLPGSDRSFFDALASLSDYEFMITVVRSKTNPFYESLLLSDIVLESSVFSRGDVERSRSMSLDDFMARVRGSVYSNLIDAHASSMRNGNIASFEKACYEHYYARLLSSAKLPVLRGFAKREVDAFNVKMALSFMGADPIRGGTLDAERLSSLSSVRSVDDLVRIVSGTYLEVLAEESSAAGMVRRLLRIQRDAVRAAARRDPLGIAQVLSYYCAYRIELRNVRIILKLVHARFDPVEIEEAIV